MNIKNYILLAVMCLFCSVPTAYSQTNDVTDVVVVPEVVSTDEVVTPAEPTTETTTETTDEVVDDTEGKSVKEGLMDIWDGISSGVTNWYFEVHALYAPDLESKYGAGVGAFYPINTYVVTGVRVDWVDGGFWMPSGNATLQLPIKPIASMPNFIVRPFVYAGIGIPLSGTEVAGYTVPGELKYNEGKPTVITGTGLSVRLWKAEDERVSFDLAADVEKWQGFPGQQYRLGLIVNYKF